MNADTKQRLLKAIEYADWGIRNEEYEGLCHALNAGMLINNLTLPERHHWIHKLLLPHKPRDKGFGEFWFKEYHKLPRIQILNLIKTELQNEKVQTDT